MCELNFSSAAQEDVVDPGSGHAPGRAEEEDATDQGGDGEVQGRVRGLPQAAPGRGAPSRGSEFPSFSLPSLVERDYTHNRANFSTA